MRARLCSDNARRVVVSRAAPGRPQACFSRAPPGVFSQWVTSDIRYYYSYCYYYYYYYLRMCVAARFCGVDARRVVVVRAAPGRPKLTSPGRPRLVPPGSPSLASSGLPRLASPGHPRPDVFTTHRTLWRNLVSRNHRRNATYYYKLKNAGLMRC